MIYQNMMIGIVFFFFQMLIREKPDIPPSAVAEATIDNKSFLQSFYLLSKNTNFMLLVVVFATN